MNVSEANRGRLFGGFLMVGCVGVVLPAVALIDVVFDQGWGFDWQDVFIVLGINLGVGLIYLLVRHLP